ncbi:YfiR family protein [bacterium]|nr:YfiR family protein [bacterium]
MPILGDKSVKIFLLGAVIVFCTLMFSRLPGHAQALFAPEYQVKAAFIYNFAKFVEWPNGTFNSETDPVILCIFPNSPKNDVFLSLTGKTVGGKRMEVKKCENIEYIEGCHILFIDSTDKKIIRECLKRVKDWSVLTVGHSKGFTQEGGIINFFTDEGKIKFEVDLEAAKRCGLKLGSQILMSAEIITKESR